MPTSTLESGSQGRRSNQETDSKTGFRIRSRRNAPKWNPRNGAKWPQKMAEDIKVIQLGHRRRHLALPGFSIRPNSDPFGYPKGDTKMLIQNQVPNQIKAQGAKVEPTERCKVAARDRASVHGRTIGRAGGRTAGGRETNSHPNPNTLIPTISIALFNSLINFPLQLTVSISL